MSTGLVLFGHGARDSRWGRTIATLAGRRGLSTVASCASRTEPVQKGVDAA
jgi:hypothetical protein